MRTEAVCVLSLALVACGKVDDEGVDPGWIDDLEDGDDAIEPLEARVGYWYTNHDETAGGVQMPGERFVPTLGGVDDSAYCAGTTGYGFTEWGAKLGVTLQQDGLVGTVLPYDITGYTGIAFRARGNIGIDVAVPTPAVLETANGGECVTSEAAPCNDFHGHPVALGANWREYELPLDALRQEGWGFAAPFDATQALAIEFEIGAGLTFDICIDDLRFY
jgi:hypothetical protein